MNISRFSYSKPLVLFLSYDGILDPLGSSQILPYLVGLSSSYSIQIISFEKDKSPIQTSTMHEYLAYNSVKWLPLSFTNSRHLLLKLLDLIRLIHNVLSCIKTQRPQLIHARGFVPSVAASLISTLFHIPFLYDYRGIWPYERFDKGLWSMGNLFHRFLFSVSLYFDNLALNTAKSIVVLTDKVKPYIISNLYHQSKPLKTIPCSADYSHFTLKTEANTTSSRRTHGIPKHSFVIGYLGSYGGMYDLNSFVSYVQYACTQRTDVHLLIVSPHHEEVASFCLEHISLIRPDCITALSASRQTIPSLLHSMDCLAAFIFPSFARSAASTTKFAEAWASGIPVLTNTGIGDCDYLIQSMNLGVVCNIRGTSIDWFTPHTNLLALDPSSIRRYSHDKFSLSRALDDYDSIYQLSLSHA